MEKWSILKFAKFDHGSPRCPVALTKSLNPIWSQLPASRYPSLRSREFTEHRGHRRRHVSSATLALFIPWKYDRAEDHKYRFPLLQGLSRNLQYLDLSHTCSAIHTIKESGLTSIRAIILFLIKGSLLHMAHYLTISLCFHPTLSLSCSRVQTRIFSIVTWRIRAFESRIKLQRTNGVSGTQQSGGLMGRLQAWLTGNVIRK